MPAHPNQLIRQKQLDAARQIKVAATFLKLAKAIAETSGQDVEDVIETEGPIALRIIPEPTTGKSYGAMKARKNNYKSQIAHHRRKPEMHAGTVRRCNLRLVKRCKAIIGNSCSTSGCKASVASLEFHHLNGDGGEHRKLIGSVGRAEVLRDWIRRGSPRFENQKFALCLACPKHHVMLDAVLGVRGRKKSPKRQIKCETKSKSK
jgi:hypothetical protein